MLIKKPADIASSDITDEGLYLRRRDFMQLGAGLLGAAAGGIIAACGRDAVDASGASPIAAAPQTPLTDIKKKMVTVSDPQNTFEQITSYNNFYEFGINKGDPAKYAGQL